MVWREQAAEPGIPSPSLDPPVGRGRGRRRTAQEARAGLIVLRRSRAGHGVDAIRRNWRSGMRRPAGGQRARVLTVPRAGYHCGRKRAALLIRRAGFESLAHAGKCSSRACRGSYVR